MPLLGPSLSTTTHRKEVVSSPGHPGPVTRSCLTGCSLGWLGNSLELGCVTAVEMSSLGQLAEAPRFPWLPNILSPLDRMASVPGQMFEAQSLSALAGAGEALGGRSAQSDSA